MLRIIPIGALTLAAAAAIGCDSGTVVQPDRVASASASYAANGNGNGKPEIDPTYANGQTVYMIGPHMIVNARETMPNAYAHAEELYLVVYPQQNVPSPGAGPVTLPSGYQPQCDPCFHPGLPAPFVYHDHVVTGAPGMGTNGTAGEFKSPWKILAHLSVGVEPRVAGESVVEPRARPFVAFRRNDHVLLGQRRSASSPTPDVARANVAG